MKKAFRGLPNGVILLSLTSLFTDVASEAIYPLLPMYLMTVLGASAMSVGIIEGIAEATASLLKLYSGVWADRLGKNKLLVFAGYMLSNLVRPMIGITQSWPQVLVLRWSDRVGKGIRSAPRDAWLAKLSSRDLLPTVYGFHRGMDHLGAVLGPLLATAFLLLYPGRYRTLFLLTLIPGMLAVALVLMTKEYGKRERRKQEWSIGLWGSLDPGLRRYLLILFLFTLGNSSDAFVLLRLQQSGVPLELIPAFWAALHVVKVIASLASGPIAQAMGSRTLILVAWGIYTLAYGSFALAADKATVIATFLLYGIFHGFSEGPERALVAKLAPERQRGVAFGFFAMTTGLAALPASLLFGAVWQSFGMTPAFLTGAALALFASFLLWLYFDEPR